MLLTIAFVLIVYLLFRSASLAQQLEGVEASLHTLQKQMIAPQLPVFGPAVAPPLEPVSKSIVEQPRTIATPPPLPPEPEPAPPPRVVTVSEVSVPAAPTKSAEPPPPTMINPAPAEPDVPPSSVQAPESQPSPSWEEVIGGNLLNKAGALILVIGIALFLGYSFANMGPVGRSAIGLLTSASILGAGLWIERKEQFRVFARGVIAAGWASLYFTSYAMHAIDAAKIIESPVIGLGFMVAVAAGMVIHSLRYKVQSLTALAFACIYASLALSPLNTLVVVALVPLAVAMLWLIHRFGWHQMTCFGAVATYGVFLSRGDSGAPLFAIQGMLLVFWILFEVADLMRPSYAFAVNAAAGIGASAWVWQHREPESMWLFCYVASLLYLLSSAARVMRKIDERPALAISASLAALAVFAHATGLWTVFFLALEAQALFVAGHYLNRPFLRVLGCVGFAASLGSIGLQRNTLIDVFGISIHSVVPAMLLHAGVFYANRILRPSMQVFTYIAAALIAGSIGIDTPWSWAGLAWLAFGVVLFEFGYFRRLAEFRYQSYGLAVLGLLGTASISRDPLTMPYVYAPGITAAVVLAYAIRASRWLVELPAFERPAIRIFGAITAPLLTAFAVMQGLPEYWWGLGWFIASIILLELAIDELPLEMLIPASILALAGTAQILLNNRGDEFAIACGLSLGLSFRLLAKPQESAAGILRTCSVLLAAFSGWLALWAMAPHEWIPLAIGCAAICLIEVGRQFKARDMESVGHLLLASASGFAVLGGPLEYWNAISLVGAHWYVAWRSREEHWISAGHMWIAGIVATTWLSANVLGGIPVLAILFLVAGERFGLRQLRWQAYTGFAVSQFLNYSSADSTVLTESVSAGALLAGCLLTSRDRTVVRTMLATGLALSTALLLYQHASGEVLTLSFGLEGIGLLAVGFLFSERILRINGLALLLVCILKLFVYDLSSLETIYRIVSFIGLGVILLAVSWAYTRCKAWF
jgi:uncharacterized membrane protein